jgi:excisionase family DNA binding protein
MASIHPGVTGRKSDGDFEPLSVSPRQACVLLGVGNTRLYQLIRDGELSTYHEGRAGSQWRAFGLVYLVSPAETITAPIRHRVRAAAPAKAKPTWCRHERRGDSPQTGRRGFRPRYNPMSGSGPFTEGSLPSGEAGAHGPGRLRGSQPCWRQLARMPRPCARTPKLAALGAR